MRVNEDLGRTPSVLFVGPLEYTYSLKLIIRAYIGPIGPTHKTATKYLADTHFNDGKKTRVYSFYHLMPANDGQVAGIQLQQSAKSIDLRSVETLSPKKNQLCDRCPEKTLCSLAFSLQCCQ